MPAVRQKKKEHSNFYFIKKSRHNVYFPTALKLARSRGRIEDLDHIIERALEGIGHVLCMTIHIIFLDH